MTAPHPAWHELVLDPPPGAHLIFWYGGPERLYEPIETFLAGAVARDDLVFLALSPENHERLKIAVRPRGLPLDRLADDGSLIRANADDLAPRDVVGVGNVGRAIASLRQQAESVGKGLSLVGQVATPVFDRGDVAIAEAIERAGAEALGRARMLCLYDARGVSLDRPDDAYAVSRHHTHSVATLNHGRFYVEALPAAPA